LPGRTALRGLNWRRSAPKRVNIGIKRLHSHGDVDRDAGIAVQFVKWGLSAIHQHAVIDSRLAP
jgi:hypothetical protein